MTQTPQDLSTTFSFRAECSQDVIELLSDARCLITGIIMKPDDLIPGSPDVLVEISARGSIEQVWGIMNGIPDSHIMMETLREVPLAENNLTRDRSVWDKFGAPGSVEPYTPPASNTEPKPNEFPEE